MIGPWFSETGKEACKCEQCRSRDRLFFKKFLAGAVIITVISAIVLTFCLLKGFK